MNTVDIKTHQNLKCSFLVFLKRSNFMEGTRQTHQNPPKTRQLWSPRQNPPKPKDFSIYFFLSFFYFLFIFEIFLNIFFKFIFSKLAGLVGSLHIWRVFGGFWWVWRVPSMISYVSCFFSYFLINF